ncbi:dihydrofolate reductase family protein [Mesorhizobium sp. LHD-90]|uniref:dihydrofolate reductase family protein n=1 Tax=Mesorhizobium sp. LHD-90 TaxID=3071414 RepID=UPI0027E1CD51|nr:dihydrofolate reductase family protein [Mesorhizobium sp. LHD-90]MDQ6435744.1 dihydrofolate reductase family protein [Mesorhizobium sp. LHD-90]
MAKLIAWNLVSLDGYFEGEKPWDLEFHNKVWGPELQELSMQFGNDAASLIFGRRTYEGMASYWKTAEPGPITTFMNALPKLVASHTLKTADWNNTRVTGDIGAAIRELKAGSQKNLYVFGSADLTHSLLQEGLVDEIILCVVPLLMGKGTPLFKPGAPVELSRLEARPLPNGGVILRYAVSHA